MTDQARLKRLPKWAQAEIARLQKELYEAKAERVEYPEVERDLLPPDHKKPLGTLSKGWNFNMYRFRSCNVFSTIDAVYKACSSSINHGEGWDRTTSQHAVRLYSTKRLAAIAMRNEFVKWTREGLGKLDKFIEGLDDD